MIYLFSASGLTCRAFSSGYPQAPEDVKLKYQTDCLPTIYLCEKDNSNVYTHIQAQQYAHPTHKFISLRTVGDYMLNIG